MKKLAKNKLFLILLTICVLIVGGLVIAWQSALYTLDNMNFRYVTPTQMAAAMREDKFWSSYRFNTLIFNGKVKSKNTLNGITSFGLETSDKYGVSCEFTNQNAELNIGQTYIFGAETYSAERQPKSVLLHDCLIF